MRYLCSDIHGQYGDFLKMLNKIQFDAQTDKLIILGDVFDRGPEPIRLIELIKAGINNRAMKLLMGNHELFAIMALGKRLKRGDITERFGELDEKRWAAFGGESTIAVLKQMDDKSQEELLDLLIGLPFYDEIQTVFGDKTVITHSGVDCDNYVINNDGTINITRSIEKAVYDNVFKALCGIDIHYVPIDDKKRFDKFVIVGHHPCFRLDPENGSNIIRSKYYMDIDTGAGHKDEGGRLSFYSIEKDEAVYID